MDSSSMGVPDTGRIPKVAAKATVILLYIIALTAASLRTTIRYHYRKLQWLDDGFLVAALVFMTAGLGLFFSMLDDLYIVEGLIYDPADTLEAIDFGDIPAIAIRVQVYTLSYNIVCISGIFAIKFSFLFFFRNILSRLPRLTLYWRGVVVYAACTWALSLGFTAYGCPYTDARAETCGQGASLYKAIDASIVLIVFDISTDILIISIPILVLKNLIVPFRKKALLGGSLCLSAVMVVVSILQAATLEYAGVEAIDIVWEIYFQYVELTVAVMVVSMTAFRAFFVQRGSRNQDSPRSPGTWSSNGRYRKAIKKVWHSSSTDESTRYSGSTQLGGLPSPDTTGVRTFISHADDFQDSNPQQGIRVDKDGIEPHDKPWSTGEELQTPTNDVVDEPIYVVSPPSTGHRIPRKMTRAQALAAAQMGNHDTHDVDLASPHLFNNHRHEMTPVSSSHSLADANFAAPSPVSPILERGGKQKDYNFPQVHLRQNLASTRFNALSPGPDADLRKTAPIPPPPPAARATEHRIEPEPAPAQTIHAPAIDSTQPQRTRSAASHIASQMEDDTRTSHDSESRAKPSPATGEAALRMAMSRSRAEPQMRESGLKRAISASIARASDFRSLREEDEAAAGS